MPNPTSMLDQSDLWGLNPSTGRLYSVEERRNSLKDRGVTGITTMLPDKSWDRWFDSVNESNYAMTGKTPAELKTGFAGGESAPGSNQLRGQSVQPMTSISGGSVAQRPSMQALSGGQRYGFSGMTTDEINNREIAPTFEQQRQGQIIAGMDARAAAGLEEERRANAEAFDYGSGRAAGRAQDQGDIARDQNRQNVRSGAQNYFDPYVRAQRDDTENREDDRLEKRYSNPAAIKAQADIAAAQARAAASVGAANATGGWNYFRQQGVNEQSGRNNVNDNLGRIGAGVAAGNPRADMSQFMPQEGAPADPSKVMSMQDFQDYMQSTGKSQQEAFADLQAGGYRLQR